MNGPNILDMVFKEREWFSNTNGYGASSEENKLELTLGPPGENWSSHKHQHQYRKNTCKEAHDSLLSLGHGTMNDHSGSASTKPWPSPVHQVPSNGAAAHGLAVVGKESLQIRNKDAAEKKGFSPSVASNTAVCNNSSQKRTAPAPVVGWPPIRSFRKNLASSSTKQLAPESQNDNKNTNHGKRATEATPANALQGLFVKINMDGIPIGRKIDLNAYDSYEKLSSAADKLFRGLLAAQSDSFTNGVSCKVKEEEKPITGLLDGSGEYTLVYEDNEGDRVLVGDVPWSMFVSTVKRLRVLKTSELRSITLGSKQQKTQADSSR